MVIERWKASEAMLLAGEIGAGDGESEALLLLIRRKYAAKKISIGIHYMNEDVHSA